MLSAPWWGAVGVHAYSYADPGLGCRGLGDDILASCRTWRSRSLTNKLGKCVRSQNLKRYFFDHPDVVRASSPTFSIISNRSESIPVVFRRKLPNRSRGNFGNTKFKVDCTRGYFLLRLSKENATFHFRLPRLPFLFLPTAGNDSILYDGQPKIIPPKTIAMGTSAFWRPAPFAKKLYLDSCYTHVTMLSAPWWGAIGVHAYSYADSVLGCQSLDDAFLASLWRNHSLQKSTNVSGRHCPPCLFCCFRQLEMSWSFTLNSKTWFHPK